MGREFGNKMYGKYIDFIGVVLFTWLLFMIVGLTTWFIIYQKYKPVCLSNGYAYTEITWKLQPYCISLDGTMIKPLDEVVGSHSSE
jgi:hypothetical protein